ncbi:MAG: acetyl-CoA carboxylase biotin carboxyl carrier protein subunit [Cytophagaceae bacterium]
MLKIKISDNNFIFFTQENNSLKINEIPFTWDITKISESKFHIIKDNKTWLVEVVQFNPETKYLTIILNNKLIPLHIQDEQDLILEKMGFTKGVGSKINEIKAPMPGLILAIKVQEGQMVKKGDPLIILEAMKMENIIKSPGDGEVKSVFVSQGNSVEKNQILIRF